MSKTRFKRPKPWVSRPQNPDAVVGWRNKPTRQQRRAETRNLAWSKWRCFVDRNGRIEQAPRDDSGLMSRRTRRSIAMTIARKAARIMEHKK